MKHSDPSRPASSTPLDEKLSEAAREEQQRALRALLQRPLLTSDSSRSPAFGLVRRHADALRDWLGHHVNWTLQVTSELARLRKIPPDLNDATRPARDARTDAAFTRARYVLLALALAALERSERQTTLGKLAEAMAGLFLSDPALAERGLLFDLKSFDQRRDLVQVIRFLLDQGVLRRVQGDEDHFLKDERSDVLYTIHRPVLVAMLSVRRGPSTIDAADFDERLAAIVEEPMPDTEDAQNRQIRVRLMRRLLDDPTLYYDELTERERAYLDRQRAFMLRHIAEAAGLAAEARAEGLAVLDPRGDMTDVGIPEEGTDGHLTLLLAEFLAERLRKDPKAVVGFAALSARTAALIEEHRRHWRKDVTAPGADRALTQMTVARLEALRLVRQVEDGVQPLPAIARYAVARENPEPILKPELELF